MVATTSLLGDSVLVFFMETCLLLQIVHAVLRDLNWAWFVESLPKIKLLRQVGHGLPRL